MSRELTELQALLVLNALPNIGPITTNRLVETLAGDPRRVFSANAKTLRAVRGVGPVIADTIAGWEKHFDLAREEERLAKTSPSTSLSTATAAAQSRRRCGCAWRSFGDRRAGSIPAVTTFAQLHAAFADGEILTLDALLEKTGLPYAELAPTLMMLELKKLVAKRLDGTYEARA